MTSVRKYFGKLFITHRNKVSKPFVYFRHPYVNESSLSVSLQNLIILDSFDFWNNWVLNVSRHEDEINSAVSAN